MQKRECPIAFDPICACLNRRPRAIRFVYSEGNALDRTAAERAAILCGGTCFPIKGAVSHGTLAEVWKQGKLAETLSALLNKDTQ